MGVMSIRKYALHMFQGQISIDNESDNKVVYLQKCQHVITLKKRKRQPKKSKKGSTPLCAFPGSGHSLPLVILSRSVMTFMKVPT